MTLYDRLASTEAGSLALAQARLRRETLRCLHRAQAASGLSCDDIATWIGGRRRDVRRDFDGDGNIPVGTLARYLHAMGYEAELAIVPAGEPRRKVLEGGHGQGCGVQPQVDLRSWSTPPDEEWIKAHMDDAFRRLRLGIWSPPDPPVQLRIDLNARTREGHVPARYHDSERPLKRGSHVIVYEPEDGVATTATVMRVYGDWVHLDVDWDEMVDAPPSDDGTGLRADALALLWHRIECWTGGR